ncbi:hypothetical protein ACN47E_001452 [Coniothyrium glycines]
MAICNFYQRGACRFGDNCKNEHPGSQRDSNRSNSGSTFGSGSSNNRFSAFGGGDRYRPSQAGGSNAFGGNRDSKPSFYLDKDDIKNDLTDQRPIYPLSSYGPGRDAPRQLIEGPVEISPEELRLRYYKLRNEGNEPQAQQEEGALNEKMQSQVKAILDDIPGAIRYIEEGANVHPNRQDIAKGHATSAPTASPFGGTASSNSNPLPQASANPFSTGASAQGSAFGKPAFGKPANPTQTASAFGQPSNPGQTTSAFGQPSNPGQNAGPFGAATALAQKPSPFGQPSALGGGSAFGKPAFGASGFGQSAFGQTSSMGQGSAFGKPSAPGAASGFGQTNALGQKASPFSNPGFGQSGFGQHAQPAANAAPFGQQAQSGASPFGQQAQSNASPFGQQAQSSTPAFGQQAQQPNQASAFGQQTQQSQPANPFSQGQQPAAAANPFGGATSSQSTAFGQPSKPGLFGTQQNQNQNQNQAAENPFLKAQTTATASAAVASSPFSTQRASTNPFGQNQPPAQQTAQPATQQGQQPGNNDAQKRFKEGRPEEYEGDVGKILEEIYRRVGQVGRFNDNEEIPMTPPKCEWIAPMPVL